MGLAIRTSRQSFAECVIIPSRLATSENSLGRFPKRLAGNAHGDPRLILQSIPRNWDWAPVTLSELDFRSHSRFLQIFRKGV